MKIFAMILFFFHIIDLMQLNGTLNKLDTLTFVYNIVRNIL